ncbi:MAG: cation-transporting P-type ATPase, partial [Candidatus Saccharicenans sp.]
MPAKKRGLWARLFNSRLEEEEKKAIIQDVSQYENQLIESSCLPLEKVFQRLQSSAKGLSSKEAEERLEEYGPNELPTKKKLGFWEDMFRRLKSPLVLQLLAIAIIAAFLGELKSTFLVSLMVLLSVGLSYVLDRRSSQAVEALGKRVKSKTLVLRNGVETEINISEVVSGDVVLLNAGSIIPADLRLIQAKDFFVSESALTGESMPVEKTAATPATPPKSALELNNACFFG